MNKIQALHSFWSSFGIPAYDENSVPIAEERIRLHGSAFPYITYEVIVDDFGNQTAQTASLWYRDSSWASITEKEQQISEFISRGGINIAYDKGAMWIQKDRPWAQRMNDPSDELVRRIVLNITIEFLD